MPLAASAKLLAQERWSSKNFLKPLQQAESGTKDAAPVSGDCFFVEPKTTSKSLQMRILDPIHDPGWDAVVALHRDAGCFHTSAWAKVLHQTYNHRPFYLQFSRGRRLAALIPLMEVRSPFTGLRGVCLPFSDACEPLVFDPEAVGLVRDRLIRFAQERRWKHLEIRGGKSFPLAPSSSAKFYGHTLHLRSGAEELTSRFGSPIRRAIRKANKSGLTVEVSSSRKAMLDFYSLHVRTRRRHGLPPQPLPFFLNIDEKIMKADLGFVILAKNRTRPIAAAVFFYSGETALFKFGASDERSHEFRGNNLVMWEGIKRLCEKGVRTLHFGRTAHDNDGLRRFKLGWGTIQEEIDYYKFDIGAEACKTDTRNRLGFHNNIFRRSPLVLNRFAGTVIYPHLD
jgi:hypothetical protein